MASRKVESSRTEWELELRAWLESELREELRVEGLARLEEEVEKRVKASRATATAMVRRARVRVEEKAARSKRSKQARREKMEGTKAARGALKLTPPAAR